MKFRLALLLAAGLCPLAGAPADPAWQDANRESATLLREGGDKTRAADLARAAFDLYAKQSKHYTAENHAQLLVNAVDARLAAAGLREALRELDRGVDVLARMVPGDSPVLVGVWQEAIRLSVRDGHSDAADRYYEKASAWADKTWGEDDPRSVLIQKQWASDERDKHRYHWARGKLVEARLRAGRTDEGRVLLPAIDLCLAKLELERGNVSDAIVKYRLVIESLDATTDSRLALTRQNAYAQLEYACGQAHDSRCAEDAHRRLLAGFGGTSGGVLPLARVAPEYPGDALARRQEGFVDLFVTIAADGSVVDATIQRAEPPHVFEEAALRAVRKWKFQPRMVDGKPVEHQGTQRIEFRTAP